MKHACEPGVEDIIIVFCFVVVVVIAVECEEQVCALLCDFLLSFEHSEDSLSSHQPFVMAALSLLAMLIENSPSEHVKESLKCKHNSYYVLYAYLGT